MGSSGEWLPVRDAGPGTTRSGAVSAEMVGAAGIEPASASPRLQDLRT